MQVPEMSQQDMFSKVMSGEEELTEGIYDEMMGEWQKGGQEMQQINRMMEEWGKTWTMEDENQQLNLPESQKSVIQFEVDNPYMQ